MHDPRREGNAFNPGMGSPTRFAHFYAGAGVVSSLYAAATTEAAICESLLHDTPLTGGILPIAGYATRTITALRLKRELSLAMLMGPGLRRLGVETQDIIATNGDVYDKTVLWAQAAHTAGFEGIAWMSARDNTAEAYIFFGDRVKESDLTVTDEGLGTFAPGSHGFTWLEAYCSLVNVELLLA
ncbi:RES family NAD+ phosphorylase [Leucobacter denitrificans]|uniref:RES family NAD+ phosphorylase n=1 Tax=Leucobacter denitrificans TaxID=683042 RepID=A0A7G9S7C8_9MICO|nr:RES family NAD+ phosphorylase [Leucobacter denitrificans]QNN63753.1 RES family NAD+ phosphorylase [Leucobacter denitrificans]